MANPRDSFSWEGSGQEFAAFTIDDSTITYDGTKANGSAQVGLAVTLTASRTVGLTTDGSRVVGKLISVEQDKLCAVQVGGFVTLPSGASASLTPGKAIVGDLDTSAKGYIREVATATAAELGVCGGIIMDATDTAAVWVLLG